MSTTDLRKRICYKDDSYNHPPCEEITIHKSKYHQIISGDLAALGKLWIDGMKRILVGANDGVPVVHAANKEEPPKRPPPMKYQDLPLDKAPHYEYKESIETCTRCSDYNRKTIQEYLQPTVRENRIQADKFLRNLVCQIQCFTYNRCLDIGYHAAKMKCYMRDDANVEFRKGTVASAAAAGLLLATAWGKGKPTKLMYTAFGAVLGGALCFPEETDKIVRNTSHSVAQSVLKLYSLYYMRKAGMRETMGCQRDVKPHTCNVQDQCKDKKNK